MPKATDVGRPGRATAAIAAACALAGAPAAAAEPEWRGAVDAVFSDLDGTRSPGCALGVIQDGAPTHVRGYGMASLEHGVPIDEDTVFYAGSVSKQFVAAAVLAAAREGRLSLDDGLRRWFPELPGWADGIAVRHLIHHTSGLRDYLSLMDLAGVPSETPVRPEWVLELIARQRALNFEPGSEYLYSNSGYFLLAQLVERATGKSLRDWAEEKLFRPLGMRRSHFHDDRDHVVRDRAPAYAPRGDGFAVAWSPAFDQVGSGGLLTTIGDLVEWDRSFYDGRLGDGFWEALVERGRLNDGETLSYAYGLHVDTERGRARIQHGGAMFGYRARLTRYPEERVTVALLCNLATADPGGRTARVARLVFGDPPEAGDEPSDDSPGSPAEEPPEETDPGALDAWTGTYSSAELAATARIERGDGTLAYQVGLSDPRPLVVRRGRIASLPGVPGSRPAARLEADGHSGTVTSFTIDAGRVRGIAFTRVEP